MTITNDRLETVLSRLKNVKQTGAGWLASCPAHDDQRPSLAVSAGNDGKVLLYCHAGCKYNDIIQSLNLDTMETKTDRRIIATYNYTDESGKLLFQKVRYEPKDFRCRIPDGSGWSYKLNGCRRVLYNLPGVVKDDIVFITEGERDADTLNRLGYTATCNFDGAGKWSQDYNPYFKGKMVYICGDNDEPGRNHVRLVFDNLKSVAGSVAIVQIPSPHKDVSDFFSAGGSIQEFNQLVADAVDAIPAGWTDAAAGAVTDDSPSGIVSSFESGTLPLIRLSQVQPKPKSWFWYNKFPNKAIVVLGGPGGAGKTTLATYIIAQVTTGRDWPDCQNHILPGSCLYFGEEDDLDTILRPKLDASGADVDKVLAFDYDRFFDAGGTFNFIDHIDRLDKTIESIGDCRAVFFDPLTGYLGSVNAKSESEVRAALVPLQNIAKRRDIAIFGLCHLNKKSDSAAGDRLLDSVGFRNIPRAVWFVTHEEETGLRYFTLVKSNYCVDATNLTFRIVNGAAVFQDGTTDKTADDILQSGRQKSDSTLECVDWLRSKLQFNSAESKEIEQQARAEGFTEYALRDAKRTLNIVAKRDGFGGKWRLYLPDGSQDNESL